MKTKRAIRQNDFAPRREGWTPEQIAAVVVGAGALGNGVCQALALLRIGSVTVIDGDRVELGNRDRCTLLGGPGAIGTFKTSVLVTEARRLFPRTNWKSLPAWFSDVGFGQLSDAHLVFCCVDNEVARLEIALVCLRLGLPLVDAGIGEGTATEGGVTWYPSREAACFGCMIPVGRLSHLLQGIDMMGASCSAPETHSGQTRLTSPSAGLIVGSCQAELGVRTAIATFNRERSALANTTAWRGQVFPSPRFEAFTADRRVDCPFHEPEDPGRRLKGPGQPDVSLRAWMSDSGEDGGILLDWPLCVAARCARCGARCQPFRYVSVVRWRLRCPNCGHGTMTPVASVRELTSAQAWSERSFEALGLSPHHWYRSRGIVVGGIVRGQVLSDGTVS